MSSLMRALAVLDLFTADRPAWTAEAIAQALDYSVPTVYRYLRELSEVGLLRGESGANFVLGPKIIELDYEIRTGDPLISAGRDSMRRLADATGCDVVLVTIFGEHIVTIHQEFGSEHIAASYGRGRRMPVFKGAMSKCLLAALPKPQLRKLHARQAGQDDAQDVPGWDDLVAQCRQVRQQGYAMSQGELDRDNVGIAVPLTSPAHNVVATLGFIMSGQRMALLEIKRAVALLQGCVEEIKARLAAPAPRDYLAPLVDASPPLNREASREKQKN